MNVLLGMTGSVATTLMPKLAKAFLDAGHDVQIVVTKSAEYLYKPDKIPKKLKRQQERDPNNLASAKGWPEVRVWTDEDEWFRSHHVRTVRHFDRYAEQAYEKDDPILHINLRKWADVFVIAPLGANTLAKFSIGMCDNLLTSVFRAWDFDKPVVLAPAMNTFMWSNPWTEMQLNILSRLQGSSGGFNVHCVDPQSKLLACGDEGIGALADISRIVGVTSNLDKTKTAKAAALASK